MMQSRRGWLRTTLAAGVAALGWPLNASSAVPTTTPSPAGRRRSLRVAQLADVHLQPQLGAARGLAKCLAHLQSLPDAPSLILNTGDTIMDSLHCDAARAAVQWDLWAQVLRDGLSLPMRSMIGNHDVWGWNKGNSKTTGDEPGWGKRRALDALGLAEPYYSFDQAGWHFVMLDSIHAHPKHVWVPRLDDAQFDWLTRDLATVDARTPVCVCTHVPILSPAAAIENAEENPLIPGRISLKGGGMHIDAQRFFTLFKAHPNVKLCLSGHLHLHERADYFGVSYVGNPAVSGNWWRGPHKGRFAESYSVIDLYDDGTFALERVPYGWTAEAGPSTVSSTSPAAYH